VTNPIHYRLLDRDGIDLGPLASNRVNWQVASLSRRDSEGYRVLAVVDPGEGRDHRRPRRGHSTASHPGATNGAASPRNGQAVCRSPRPRRRRLRRRWVTNSHARSPPQLGASAAAPGVAPIRRLRR